MPSNSGSPLKPPRVSVVIPCYNHGRYLKETVNSVLSQTFQDFEIIIVDDGSTDGSVSIARHLLELHPDISITLIAQGNSGHPGAARNRGMLAARGEYLLPLDADDRIAPEMLAACVGLLDQNPEIAIAYTDVKCFNEETSWHLAATDYDFSRLRYANQFSHCAMFRRVVWEAVGGYSTNVLGYEDWNFWLTLGEHGFTGERIQLPLFEYRVSGSGLYSNSLQYHDLLHASIISSHPSIYPALELKAAQKLITKKSDPRISVVDKIAELLSLAEKEYQHGDARNATSLAEQALAFDLTDPHLNAITCLYALHADGDIKSRDFYQRQLAVKLQEDPWNADALIGTALCQAAAGDTLSAQSLLLKASAVMQTSPLILDASQIVQSVSEGSMEEKLSSPFVSIIVPTHNRPELLKRALFSAVGQTYSDFEVIVVNDAGDDVRHVVDPLNAGGRIRYLEHETNRGLAAARNTGIRAARGSYMCYLDDDDELYPYHLETLVNFLLRSEVKAAYTDAHRAWQRHENGQWITYKKDLPYSRDFDRGMLLLDNYIPVLCVMHARECLDESGLFDESLPVLEDYDLWLRLSETCPFAHIPKVTCAFRWTEDQSTMTGKKQELFAQTRQRIHGRYELPRAQAQVRQMQGLIDGLNELAAQKDQRILWLEQAADKKQAEIERLEATRIAENEEAEHHLLKLRAEIERLEQARIAEHTEAERQWKDLCEQREKVEHLMVQLEENQALVGIKDTQLDMERATNDRLLWQLSEIERSRAWKLVKGMWKVRLKVLPDGSPQTRLARRIYRTMRPLPTAASVPSRLDPVAQPVQPVSTAPTDPLLQSLEAVKGFLDQPPAVPLVSIVIPTYNLLDYLRQCVESILTAKREFPIEIVVVNNASQDDTRAWLDAMHSVHPELIAIHNEDNKGFGLAVNQGVEASRGKYVVVANNDLVMSREWLVRLVDAMERDQTLGVLSPMTNYVGHGPQLDSGAVDLSPENIEVYARSIASRGEDVIKVPIRLVFFCVITRRTLWDQIGGLSGVYGFGNFEDDDFCLRARMAGYSLGVLPSAFVFHYGSKTFTTQNVSHHFMMDHNRTIFYERTAQAATTLDPFWSRQPRKEVLASVIVRTQNRPTHLRKALTSLANQTYRDFEVVLVNDGGPDIPDLVAEFSSFLDINYIRHDTACGRVKALNSGLRAARGVWITYLDDDDIVYPAHLELLTGPFLSDPQTQVSYTNCIKALCLNNDGSDVVISRIPWTIFEFNPDKLLVQNFIPIMSFMHSREIVEQAGMFNEEMDVLEDWDFLIRLSRLTKFHHVSQISCEYRFRVGAEMQNSITVGRARTREIIREIYERYPTDQPEILAQREAVMQATLDQIGLLERVQELDAGDLERNLLVADLTSGFPVSTYRRDGFRA